MNTNGPVPTAAGGPPWAYLLFLKSGALASPSFRALGLEKVNGVSVSVTRNAEFGAFSLIDERSVGSGAVVSAILPVMTVSM